MTPVPFSMFRSTLHLALVIIIQLPLTLLLPIDPQLNVNNTDFPRFDYRNADWNCINAEFCEINWIHLIDQLDCDQVYDFFYIITY